MENYNYDFINYMDKNSYGYNMINDLQNNLNYIPKMNESKVKKLNNNILDPYQAFKRGNSFANLYDAYKNYQPGDINPTTEREALLNQYQQYEFILKDLNLYLDIHPNNSQVLNLYNKYLEIKEQICKQYESKYGPITLSSSNLGTNNWKWINSPWPWEGIK